MNFLKNFDESVTELPMSINLFVYLRRRKAKTIGDAYDTIAEPTIHQKLKDELLGAFGINESRYTNRLVQRAPEEKPETGPPLELELTTLKGTPGISGRFLFWLDVFGIVTLGDLHAKPLSDFSERTLQLNSFPREANAVLMKFGLPPKFEEKRPREH